MKCLKTEEYVQLLSCETEAKVLHDELEKQVEDGRLGLFSSTMCDRIIRACNQLLGSEKLTSAHQDQIVELVELAVKGFDLVERSVQSNPFYLEKILFHILKKFSSLGAHGPACQLAQILSKRLRLLPTETEDFQVLVRNCFAVLWNNLLSKSLCGTALPPKERLHYQLQALTFKFLELESNSGPFPSRIPVLVEGAIAEYKLSCSQFCNDEASFLISEIQDLVLSFSLLSKRSSQALALLAMSCEVVFKVCKLLCKSEFHAEALRLLNEVQQSLTGHGLLSTARSLADQAVRLSCNLSSGGECGKIFTESARILRELPSAMSAHETHLLFEASQLNVWVLQDCQCKGMDVSTLLSLFSFLEEHQEILLQCKKDDSSQHLQYTLCFNYYQGFSTTENILRNCELPGGDDLDRVILYLKATAGRMFTELQMLKQNDNFLLNFVATLNNVVIELQQRKFYDGAIDLAVILCQELCKNSPPCLPVEKINRCFLLTVKVCRSAGQLEKALDWVVRWIHVLGKQIFDHFTEPVSQWVKTKCDAARAGDDDASLRTLKDGLGEVSVDEEVLICLLEEELRVYNEQTGDTARDRYNILCDLLEIYHEDTPHTLKRASYLCEMAQVVCYQDFSQHTDCSAIDFADEALKLLELEPETIENEERLKDEKARSSLWLFICSLESNLQEAVNTEKRLRAVQEQRKTGMNLDPAPTNDLEYEDKQKSLDSQIIYDGLRFNLLAHNKLSEPLDRCLSLWRSLLKGSVPAVRDPKLTGSSIMLMAALYKLMGKHLQALEGYQLAASLFRSLGDAINSATAFCCSCRILLFMGSPQLAQMELEKAENVLRTEPGSISVNSLLILLQKANLHYASGEVEIGVNCLMKVIKESALHHSKTWYLLRAQALQTASDYLSLDTQALKPAMRDVITQNGLKTPDTAQYEALKLLCSLVMKLLGNGFYGASGSNTDTHFADQGDGVVFKWLLLSEVLVCSERMVAVRSSSGAIHEAKAQCLEALKLATKLQTLSHCAQLLVMKAELEMMKGETEASSLDLEQVRNLLDLCIDFGQGRHQKCVKIKPRKGRPAALSSSDQDHDKAEELSGILRSRTIFKEPVDSLSRLGSQGSSPPLKSKTQHSLSCLTHVKTCSCPCCSELSIARVCIHWALLQAELQTDQKSSCGLRHSARKRCNSIIAKVQRNLETLVPSKKSNIPSLSLLQAELGKVQLASIFQLFRTGDKKVSGLWNEIEAGLEAVKPKGSVTPELGPIRASLLAAKAVACCLGVAVKKQCKPEEVFSSVWNWKLSKIQAESKQRARSPVSDIPLLEMVEGKHPPEIKPFSTEQKTKKSSVVSKKTKDSVPKMCFSQTAIVFKTPKATRTPRVTPAFSADDFKVFDFPQTSANFTPSQTPARHFQSAKQRAAFKVFEDPPSTAEKPVVVPAAPKRSKRSRFKVVFSDESDTEAADVAETVEKKHNTVSAKPHCTTKTVSKSTNVEPVPPRCTRTAKKSTALPTSSSEDESCYSIQTRARRGRPKKSSETTEDPERMRMIKEDEVLLNVSLDDLKGFDTEMQDTGLDADCEVLRRDLAADVGREFFTSPRSPRHNPEPHTPLPHAPFAEFSMEMFQSYLRSSWLLLHHFPPSLYPHVCSMLALSLGQTDPLSTAMLHAQSLGVLTRHQMTRHVVNQIGKSKPVSSDVAEGLGALSLEETSEYKHSLSLSALEQIYSFTPSESTDFPFTHSQQFCEQLKDLPAGISVCLLSTVTMYPGEVGDTLLLTRLERGCGPITVRIPTAGRECSISILMEKIDGILKEQKEVSALTEKAQWWEGRMSLDAQVEKLLKEMEKSLGLWRTLLLPMSSDPELEAHVQGLLASFRDTKLTQDVLKVFLSASPLLSSADLHSLLHGMGLKDKDLFRRLQIAVLKLMLKERKEPQGHTVLILDKYLQRLPWENISCLKSCSVSRMPSLHAVLGHGRQQQMNSSSVLSCGVNPKQVYYVVNPDLNLSNTEMCFKDWFSSERAWMGVCGTPPDPDKLQEAIATKDLYIYIGHGAGAQFLDAKRVLKAPVRAVTLLFGCSSAALNVQRHQEGTGIVHSYITAGCPFVLGNLWDVTDRDMDRFTTALLRSWLSAGSGSSLLQHLAQSRDATRLKHIIGAAPIAYGLPVFIQ